MKPIFSCLVIHTFFHGHFSLNIFNEVYLTCMHVFKILSPVYPTLTPPPPNARCDLNWYGRNGNCYYLGLAQPRTALDAEFYCQSRQAHLVSVETKEENDYLQTTISQLAVQGQSFWTGLHKSLDCMCCLKYILWWILFYTPSLN